MISRLSKQLLKCRFIVRSSYTLTQIPTYRFCSDQSHPDFQTQKKESPSEGVLKEKHDFIDKGNPAAPMCGYSNYAVQVLQFYKIKDYHSVDVLSDPILREEIKKYSNWPTFPQLYVNQQLIGGCDIMTEMHKDGSLKELFDKL